MMFALISSPDLTARTDTHTSSVQLNLIHERQTVNHKTLVPPLLILHYQTQSREQRSESLADGEVVVTDWQSNANEEPRLWLLLGDRISRVAEAETIRRLEALIRDKSEPDKFAPVYSYA